MEDRRTQTAGQHIDRMAEALSGLPGTFTWSISLGRGEVRVLIHGEFNPWTRSAGRWEFHAATGTAPDKQGKDGLERITKEVIKTAESLKTRDR